MIEPRFRWHSRAIPAVDPACLEVGAQRGISQRLLRLLVGRGIATPAAITAFLAPAEDGLHDPRLLPDADVALARIAQAKRDGERALVYGDFDADGLTGLSILVLALREIGIDAEPYVPDRIGDGHGLSARAIERAVAEHRTLIVTADCGTSSGAEIEDARSRGIDVIVTDHHHASSLPAAAVAVVNPQREDCRYPEKQLTGAGVAWKVAHLLIAELGVGDRASGVLPQAVRDLADLALIGTVADVAPALGENRSIARLGLECLRKNARPGLAALMSRAGLGPGGLTLEDIGFGVAPRLNAAGRMGEAARAARLLLASDQAEAELLAEELELANRDRREVTRTAVAEARHALGLSASAEPDVAGAAPAAAAPQEPLPPALLVRGEWPVGIIGLIAGRLAEDLGRPAVVATTIDAEGNVLRASCRSHGNMNLAETLIACGDLLIRHGGHRAAAGFDIEAGRWPEFAERFLGLSEAAVPEPEGRPELLIDLVVAGDAVDFAFVRELSLLDPFGSGNLAPVVAITGLRVSRARAASGGHTQLVLRRTKDVLDGIAFRRPDLAVMLHDGDRVDVAARVSSRRFGGFESIQLEVIDVAAARTVAPARAGA